MLLSRVDSISNEDPGRNSKRTEGSKTESLFSSSGSVWQLHSKPSSYGDELYNKWNTSVSRPNNVEELVSSLDKGGSVGLMGNSLQELLTNRMCRIDSMKMFCINLYLWLQKSILCYSAGSNSGLETHGTEIEVQVTRKNADNLMSIVHERDICIDVDAFSDRELMVLLIGLEGAGRVKCTLSGQVDIFSGLQTERRPYVLVSSRGVSSKASLLLSILQPEVALRTIYSVVCKLGVLSDWLDTPSYVRGKAFQKSKMESSGLISAASSGYVLDVPPDRCYSTIFGNICKQCNNTVDNVSNLGASTSGLILEILMGQFTINNIHYICEALCIIDNTLFDTSSSNDKLYESYMLEMGMRDMSSSSKLIEAIYPTDRNSKMYGANKMLLSAVKKYCNMSWSDREKAMWLQINVVIGGVLSGNSSNSVGKQQKIGASTLGPLLKDVDEVEDANTWMIMHYLSDDKLSIRTALDCTSIVMPRSSNVLSAETKLVAGVYECQRTEISLSNNVIGRRGYEQLRPSSMAHTVVYFSAGNAGDDAHMVDKDHTGPSDVRLVEMPSESTAIELMNEPRIDDRRRRELLSLNKVLDDQLHKAKGRKREEAEEEVRVSLPAKPGVSLGDSELKRYIHEERERRDNVMVSKSVGNSNLQKHLELSRYSRPEVKDRFQAAINVDVDLPKVKFKDTPDEQVDVVHKVDTGQISGQAECGSNAERFNVIESDPDGNCLAASISNYLKQNHLMTAGSAVMRLAGWNPDGQWLSNDDAFILGNILNHDVNIYQISDREGVSNYVERLKLENPSGIINLRHDGSHYDLLVPDNEGETLISYENDVKWVFSEGEVQPNIARLYSKVLNVNGVQHNCIDVGDWIKLNTNSNNIARRIIMRPTDYETSSGMFKVRNYDANRMGKYFDHEHGLGVDNLKHVEVNVRRSGKPKKSKKSKKRK
jgi:hypothetical protein